MKKLLLIGFVLLGFTATFAQDPELVRLQGERERLLKEIVLIDGKIEGRKLSNVQTDLQAKGLPALKAGEEVVMHSCMALVYDEPHEQAKWVAHIVTPDIIEGKITRSNDFRVDPAVKTGTADEVDFFQKTQKPDGTYDYDGFGYDRIDSVMRDEGAAENVICQARHPKHPAIDGDGDGLEMFAHPNGGEGDQ